MFDARLLPHLYTRAVSRARGIPPALRGRAGIAAIVALGLAWGLLMHAMGWAQSSFYAQVRALSHGETKIDRWHWETGDKAWIDRHYYSVKAPGLAAMTLPVYQGLDAVGAKAVARDAAANARDTDHPALDVRVRHRRRRTRSSGTVARARAPGVGPDRGRGADGVGADAVRGGAPGDRPAVRRALGRGPDRTRVRDRRGDHAWAGVDRDGFRRRVLRRT